MRSPFWVAAFGFAAALVSPAQTPADLYTSHIQPLFQKSCLPCHNAASSQGGLDLSSRAAMLKGSEHGPVVLPGKPEQSQLYKVVAHISKPTMPFNGKKLAEADVAKIADWIRDGAEFGPPAKDPDGVDLAEVQKHWAFRNPVRPVVPAGRFANPIDAFVDAERGKHGVKAAGPASKTTLIRRVYLDLIGLPPTPEEVAVFVSDADPKAYDKLVDRLLASPAYGERWGRHWLDIWRYSDWYGYRQSAQVRYSQRHIWRWRDWTVESLNANKPYDRMIQEMVAGDELAPGDPAVARATGYLARSWYLFNRNVWLSDVVEYTSASFMGLTLKCARCHNHKYDPIPQADYYRFRAFFEPHEVRTDRVPGQADILKDGLPRVYDADGSRPTYRFIRGNEATPDESIQLQPAVPKLFGKVDLNIKPVPLPLADSFPDTRAFVPGDLIAEAKAKIEKAQAELEKAKAKPEPDAVIRAAERRVEAAKADLPALEARIQADLAASQTPVPANVEDLAATARKLEKEANRLHADAAMILARHEFDLAAGDEKKLGKPTAKLEEAAKLLKEPAEGYTPIGPKYPTSSTGRRLALAKWIASRENPLTARVAINDMWGRHFGKPLVSTVFNFGRSGKAPSHPQLLDWLAVEFMDRGWDMKAMHRLMVTSDTYKMSSTAVDASVDPDNVYLGHMNPKRMEAEVVRDSMLAIAGKLDRTMGGADIDEKKGDSVFRRTIYFRTAPDLQMDIAQAFDVASPIECFERSVSIVPQQALALSNGPLSFTVARTVAGQLQAPDAKKFAEQAFARILGRAASPQELAASVEYLASQAELYRDPAKLTVIANGPEASVPPSKDPQQRARESLVHVLLNHNDFVTIR
ncbi:cytochrome c [Bryobacterales bacterium F-183]|nr:cytochrome c [Bryobacterales bacterium F-183]